MRLRELEVLEKIASAGDSKSCSARRVLPTALLTCCKPTPLAQAIAPGAIVFPGSTIIKRRFGVSDLCAQSFACGTERGYLFVARRLTRTVVNQPLIKAERYRVFALGGPPDAALEI